MPDIQNPALVNWKLRTHKRQNDELTMQLVAPAFFQKHNPQILSLPASQWLWEQRIAREFGKGQFTGLERDPKVFQRMRNNARKLRGELPKKVSFEPWKSAVVPFLDALTIPQDVIYLDFMGTWAEDKRDALTLIADNNLLRKGGFLLVTLSLVRGRISADELDEYTQGHHNILILDRRPRQQNIEGGTKKKVRGIMGWTEILADNSGQEWYPKLAQIYYNIGRDFTPKPEVLMCFQRMS